MTEKDPGFNINIGERKFELNRSNAEVYGYLGRIALDHFFIVSSVTDEVRTGTRLWRECFEDGDFDKVANYMLERGYAGHINLQDVPDDDMDAYIRFDRSGEPDMIPEDWLQ